MVLNERREVVESIYRYGMMVGGRCIDARRYCVGYLYDQWMVVKRELRWCENSKESRRLALRMRARSMKRTAGCTSKRRSVAD